MVFQGFAGKKKKDKFRWNRDLLRNEKKHKTKQNKKN